MKHKKMFSAILSFIFALNSVPIVIPQLSAEAAQTSADATQWDYNVTIEQVRSMQNFLLNNTEGVKIPMDQSFDLNGDGRIDVFDLCLLKRKYVEQQEKSGSFYSLSSDLVQENDTKYGTAVMSDDFYSKRVIVKAKTAYEFHDFSPTSIISGPDNIYVVQFDTVENAEVCMSALRQDDNIEYAELDEYMNCGKPTMAQTASANSWGVSTIEADQYAEYLSNTSNSNVVVAVVDTGVSAHSFIGDRLLNTGYDLVDNDPDPNDKHYHGTHVAGTVVDCTPGLNINIMAVRVLDENGCGSNLNVGNGIRYATEHGANVINLSLGGYGCSEYIDDSIDYAVDNGTTVVVAAGNDANNTIYYCPAHLDNCIIVAASDSDNQKAYFSNYGNSVDVIAPGVDILSCIPGGGYKTLSGTSMATPHISAAAAMIKYAKPQASPYEIEELLKEISLDLGDPGKDVYYGYGLPKLSNLIEDNPEITPSIILSESKVSMNVGDSLKLTASTVPSAQTVNWKSSNSKVATVEEGAISAVSAGNSTITASFSYNSKTYTAECEITVADNSGNIVLSGQCGDNAYYELDENGLLTISGLGKMWDYNCETESGSTVFWSSANTHDESPFKLNNKIKKVVIEEGITYLGTCTFAFCSNLKDIDLPDTLMRIDKYVFYSCTSLEEITIPKNVEWIGECYRSTEGNTIFMYWTCGDAFSKCSSLKSIHVANGNQYFADDNGALISANGETLFYIPLAKNDYVLSDKLVYLASTCGKENLTITELIIPKSVKFIGEDAFNGCKNLIDLQLNQGLETIGRDAFRDSGVTSVNIPSTVRTLGSSAFNDCYSLESVTFDKYGTESLVISQDVFWDCTKLKSVELPERATCIGGRAFYRCYNLEYIRVLNYNMAIQPDGSFNGSTDACTLGTKSTMICGYAGSTAEKYANECGHVFLNIDKNYIIPTSGIFGDGLNWKFSDDTLTISGNGEIPEWETHSWSKSFVDFDNEIPPWWVYKDSIKKIVINNGVTKIGENAFIIHYNLESISIPKSIGSIEDSFIAYSSVKEITIPESVTSLDQLTFYKAESLEKVTILNPKCSFGWTMNQYMIPESTVIYGYSGSTAETYATKYNRTFVAID